MSFAVRGVIRQDLGPDPVQEPGRIKVPSPEHLAQAQTDLRHEPVVRPETIAELAIVDEPFRARLVVRPPDIDGAAR